MNLNFRRADISEIDIAFKLLREAAEWLEKEEIDHWQSWHKPSIKSRDWVREGFEQKQFYFVEREEEIVGTFRLQYNDQMYWGNRDDNAGYIHSFTTKRSLKGDGVGREILRYIENKLKSKSIDFLRLDCGADNKSLRNYYEDYGFKKVGETEVESEILTLYEKKVK